MKLMRPAALAVLSLWGCLPMCAQEKVAEHIGQLQNIESMATDAAAAVEKTIGKSDFLLSERYASESQELREQIPLLSTCINDLRQDPTDPSYSLVCLLALLALRAKTDSIRTMALVNSSQLQIIGKESIHQETLANLSGRFTALNEQIDRTLASGFGVTNEMILAERRQATKNLQACVETLTPKTR